ncbi:orotate phosphoribosyltransferase, partial [gut metagenome]
MFKSSIAENILAEHLLNNGAVSFMTAAPLRLRSGLITPIYVDNRVIPAYPEAWRDIIETTATKIAELGLEFDIVAGVEGAGVSHAAALAYRLSKPHVFVRTAAKT